MAIECSGKSLNTLTRRGVEVYNEAFELGEMRHGGVFVTCHGDATEFSLSETYESC